MHFFSGFSPANSPHLTPALELDTAIIEFSSKLKANGLPTTVSSEGDLDLIVGAFEKVVNGLNLWQYYVLDPAREKESVKAALSSGKIAPWAGPGIKSKDVGTLCDILRSEKSVTGLGQLASRFGVHVDGAVAAGFVQAAFADIHDAEALSIAWVKVVDVLNVPLYREWEDDTKAATSGIRNRLKYTRLDPHGPKMGEISEKWVFLGLKLLKFTDICVAGAHSSSHTLPELLPKPMPTHWFIQLRIMVGFGLPTHCRTSHSSHPRRIFVVKLSSGVTA